MKQPHAIIEPIKFPSHRAHQRKNKSKRYYFHYVVEMKQPHPVTEPLGKALSWQKADGSFHVTDRCWRKRFLPLGPSQCLKKINEINKPNMASIKRPERAFWNGPAVLLVCYDVISIEGVNASRNGTIRLFDDFLKNSFWILDSWNAAFNAKANVSRNGPDSYSFFLVVFFQDCSAE